MGQTGGHVHCPEPSEASKQVQGEPVDLWDGYSDIKPTVYLVESVMGKGMEKVTLTPNPRVAVQGHDQVLPMGNLTSNPSAILQDPLGSMTFLPRNQLNPTLLSLFSGRFGRLTWEGPKHLEVGRRFEPIIFFYGNQVTKSVAAYILSRREVVNYNYKNVAL